MAGEQKGTMYHLPALKGHRREPATGKLITFYFPGLYKANYSCFQWKNV